MADFATLRQRMVDNQLRTSNVTDHRILAAMDKVPRELFVPEARRDLAYADVAHSLAAGRWLGAPAPFARLLQLAEIAHTDHVLDVGAGTGYGTAILADIAAEVTGLEPDAGLAATARANLQAVGALNAEIVEGGFDGAALKGRAYDVIVVEGALDAEPTALFDLLAEAGRLVVLIRTSGPAVAHVFVRSGGEVAGRSEFNTSLPPLAPVARPESFVF